MSLERPPPVTKMNLPPVNICVMTWLIMSALVVALLSKGVKRDFLLSVSTAVSLCLKVQSARLIFESLNKTQTNPLTRSQHFVTINYLTHCTFSDIPGLCIACSGVPVFCFGFVLLLLLENKSSLLSQLN